MVFIPDAQTTGAVITSVKTAMDITRAMISVRDTAKIQTMQADLQRTLLEALEYAVTAKSGQLDLISRAEALEKENARLVEWNAREGEYKLEEIPTGAFAYVSQPTGDSGATEVWLCPNCFESKQRAVLQYAGRSKGGHGEDEWRCRPCGTILLVEMGISPGRWRARQREVVKYRTENDL
jgi:hypothetical protein